MHKFIFLAVMLQLSCTAATACTYGVPPKFRKSFPTADQVFLFRLDSIAVAEERRDKVDRPEVVAGRIKIIESYRGSPKAQFIRFTTGFCGGLRLDVGHFYVIATSQSGTVLELAPGDESLIDFKDHMYYDRDKVRAALRRGNLPKDFPSFDETNYTLSLPYPPPAPSKKNSRR